MNTLRNKKGFTLVELIVVIVIIAILAAALVTSLIGYINKASDTTALVEAQNAYTAAQAVITEDIATKATPAYVAASGTITNEGETADEVTALEAQINEYLGADNAATAKVKTVTLDSKGTITAFDYLVNGRTVSFTTSGGWEVN